MKQIIIATADDDIRRTMEQALPNGSQLTYAENKSGTLTAIKKIHPDLVFLDLGMLLDGSDRNTAADRMKEFKTLCEDSEVVVMANKDCIRSAVNTVKAGAADYLTCPIDPSEVHLVVTGLEANRIASSELDHLREQFWGPDVRKAVQTRHPVMQQVYDSIRLVARTKSSVLLTGETGTGKTMLAKLIHSHSNRAEQAFISVHCGAIPDTLIESELFGHEKGAFTGADHKKLGKFEIAKSGTIFLDEVGTLTPAAQIKLLQVLQDNTFSRVGGTEILKADARVITATNDDLKAAVEDGRFRRDLYYRLNVFPIDIPPLSQRVDDIPYLIDLFLKRLNNDMQKNIHAVEPRVTAALKRYAWPGNIRELENLVERAYILEQSAVLTPESFPAELFEGDMTVAVVPVSAQMPLSAARHLAVEDFERQYLKELLTANMGRINRSAEIAGITSRQLHKLMQKYHLHKEDFIKKA
ncbi:MAG: sigma-54 dependent transcriptional regulator [Desulfobacteraceae bacterium]